MGRVSDTEGAAPHTCAPPQLSPRSRSSLDYRYHTLVTTFLRSYRAYLPPAVLFGHLEAVYELTGGSSAVLPPPSLVICERVLYVLNFWVQGFYVFRSPHAHSAPFRAASIRRCSSARPPKKLRTAAIPSACVGGTRSPPAIHFGSRSLTAALAKRESANTIAA